ncbi:hypothetical protein GDO86_004917 [Hymenochirus boettgeri]|uniref:Uncharacterized protein n=1 Tax=Hymenochirus boettgeri TaxID=247094 RepID=A0A8T2IZQ9_9PIPI|nr:hypothetical protein GDO86_004917 [Hymenochirus boettgeri]
MVVSLLCSLVFSFGGMPAYMVLMRSLKPKEKALGLGLHLLASRVIGGIPSSVTFGALVDTTCMKWGFLKNGEIGACRMYETDMFRGVFNGLSVGVRVASYIPCVFVLLILKREAAQNKKVPPEIEMDVEERN